MTFTPDLKLFEDRKLSQPNNDIIQHGDSDISNNHYFHVIFKAKMMSSCTVKKVAGYLDELSVTHQIMMICSYTVKTVIVFNLVGYS